MTARQQAAMNHFVSAGYTPRGAAAIVGNLSGESGVNLDSTLFRAHPDASGGVAYLDKSGGIAEWMNTEPGIGRKANVIAFAKRQGIDPNDLGIQCDFVIYELQTKWATLDAQLRPPSTRSVENLTANFCWIYESPNRAMANLDGRIEQANKCLAAYEALHAEPTPAPLPVPVPIPRAPAPPPAPIPSPLPPQLPPSPQPPPVAAPAAGRLAAVLDALITIQQKYAADRAAADAEEAVIDAAINALEKISPLPAAPAASLPPPASNPKGTQVATPTPITPSWITAIFGQSPVTSIFGSGGILAAGAAVYEAVQSGRPPDPMQVSLLLGIVSTAIGLLRAKDSNVTGGSIAATPEAASRIAKQ